MLKDYKKLLPVLIIILISSIYFIPALEGKKIVASDTQAFMGMSKEIQDYREETGEEALWTNRLFGGMPGYFISVNYPGNLFSHVQDFLNKIPRPINFLILYMLLFYVLCLILNINIWISLAGSFAYGFFTFIFIIIDTGHASKAETLSYLSLVVAGVLAAYNKNRNVGSVLTGVGLSFMLAAGHPQMTYYAGILIGILGITYLIFAIREKTLPAFAKTSSLLVIGALLAVGTNFSRMYTSYEYSKYSMRGESELTPKDDNQTSGLDRDYILSYSYDLGEAMTAFIPRFKGGGMSEPLGEKSKVYQLIEQSQGKQTARQISENLPLYWGSQPIVGAPFYYGAVLCFLFVLSLFIVKGKDRWWLITVVVVSFLLSLGKNFSLLSNFMIDYFPAYNKFRDVKNIVVIQQFAMALLGVFAVREVFQQTQKTDSLLKCLKYAYWITGGLAFLFVVMPGLAGNFQGATDAQLAQSGWPAQLIDALQSDRKMVLRSDAFRTFVFVSLAAAGVWLVIKKKIKPKYALLLWIALIFADLWPVNKKYLNNDSFETKSKAESPFQLTKASQEILKDTDPNYRVLNIAANTFNDASTSYFHNSVGGYHGAKLLRYQEMIEHHIAPEMQQLRSRLGNIQSQADVDTVFQGLDVLNMLNTRYVIYNPEAAPLYNSQALGNAWFVGDLELVENADEEIEAIGDFDAASVAIVDHRFADVLTDVSFAPRTQPFIQLKEYKPNYLSYEATVENGTPLAVFSEVYYPAGWNAYLDAEPVEHVCANYILRALPVPEGKHEIEFKFEPKSYFVGNKISLISSLILILALVAAGISEYKKKAKNEEKRPARIRKRLIRSYLTATISITLVLFLVGMVSLLVLNAGKLSDYVRENVGFTLILNEEVREAEILRLQKILKASDYVKSTKYVDKEEAAAQLTRELGEDFVGFLGFNPLFSSIDVKLHADYMQPDSLAIMENNFLSYPQVKEVYYQRDLVRTINENVQRISLFLLIFSALLLFIFSTLINNTIRIAIYSQRFIIHTMKLVGATRSFIRRPFIMKNLVCGIVGGLLANLGIFGLIYSYRKDVEGILDLQQLDTVGPVFMIVMVFGVLIAWLSTLLSVNKYLRLKYDELFY